MSAKTELMKHISEMNFSKISGRKDKCWWQPKICLRKSATSILGNALVGHRKQTICKGCHECQKTKIIGYFEDL